MLPSSWEFLTRRGFRLVADPILRPATEAPLRHEFTAEHRRAGETWQRPSRAARRGSSSTNDEARLQQNNRSPPRDRGPAREAPHRAATERRTLSHHAGSSAPGAPGHSTSAPGSTRIEVISPLNVRPACTPVNASRGRLRQKGAQLGASFLYAFDTERRLLLPAEAAGTCLPAMPAPRVWCVQSSCAR
jgi:hypothetical protein